MIWIILACSVASFFIGVGLASSSTPDKPWRNHCKYCGKFGHGFTSCSTLSQKQKDALETLYSEDTVIHNAIRYR